MVRTRATLAFALLAAIPLIGGEPALSEAATAMSVSQSSRVERVQALAELPPRPQAPLLQPNRAWEDAAAITLVSLPFTAFWALLGALAVGGASQGRFPPELSTDMLAGAAMVAGGSSLAIGLFSISWGGPSHPASASQP